jgi:hypothetical protein
MVIVIGRNHVLVKSATRDGYHAVDLEPVEDLPDGGCSCEGFEARKTCWHWKLLTGAP